MTIRNHSQAANLAEARYHGCAACGRAPDELEECTDERCMTLCDIRRMAMTKPQSAPAHHTIQVEPKNPVVVAFEAWWMDQEHALEMSPAVKFAAWNGWLAATSRSEQGPKFEWVPVGERRPDPYETVLLNCDGELRSTGFWDGSGERGAGWTVDAEDPSDGSRWIVTHWQELPACPQADPQDRMEESPRDASGNSPASNASSGDLPTAQCVAAPKETFGPYRHPNDDPDQHDMEGRGRTGRW